MEGWLVGWWSFFVQKYLLNFNYCTKREKEDGNKIQNLCANLMKASAGGGAAGGWGCFIKNCVGAEVEATAASNAAPIPVFSDVHLLLGSSRRLRQVTNSNLN